MTAIQADCEERRPDLLQVDFSLAHHKRVGRFLFFGSRSNKVFSKIGNQRKAILSDHPRWVRRCLEIASYNRILRLTVQPQFPNKTFIRQSRFKFPACVITGRYGARFQSPVGYRQ